MPRRAHVRRKSQPETAIKRYCRPGAIPIFAVVHVNKNAAAGVVINGSPTGIIAIERASLSLGNLVPATELLGRTGAAQSQPWAVQVRTYETKRAVRPG